MAILLDEYAESRIEAIRARLKLEPARFVEGVAELVNEINFALWTLPEVEGKSVPIHGQVVKLDVTKKMLANIQRLLKDLGRSQLSPGNEVSNWLGSFRNAIEINLGQEWLPKDDSDRHRHQSAE